MPLQPGGGGGQTEEGAIEEFFGVLKVRHDEKFTLCKTSYVTLSAIRSFRRFCKQFSESSPCIPGKQGSSITTLELSEKKIQNLGNDLMADIVFLLLGNDNVSL